MSRDAKRPGTLVNDCANRRKRIGCKLARTWFCRIFDRFQDAMDHATAVVHACRSHLIHLFGVHLGDWLFGAAPGHAPRLQFTCHGSLIETEKQVPVNLSTRSTNRSQIWHSGGQRQVLDDDHFSRASILLPLRGTRQYVIFWQSRITNDLCHDNRRHRRL